MTKTISYLNTRYDQELTNFEPIESTIGLQFKLEYQM